MSVRRAMAGGLVAIVVTLGCGQPLFKAPAPLPSRPEPSFVPPDSAAEIRAIAWERTSCFGVCPVYQVHLDADGQASWKGDFPKQFKDSGATTITDSAFKQLAGRILAEGFFGWDSSQSEYVIDAPTLVIKVTLADGRTKRVGGEGPLHQGLGRALDSAAATLAWKEGPKPFE